jgi:hypothetical protein
MREDIEKKAEVQEQAQVRESGIEMLSNKGSFKAI